MVWALLLVLSVKCALKLGPSRFMGFAAAPSCLEGLTVIHFPHVVVYHVHQVYKWKRSDPHSMPVTVLRSVAQ